MTEPEAKTLRDHLANLAAGRRQRAARRGDFGPVIASLHRIADLIEHKQRTDPRYKPTRTRTTARPVWVYADMILHRAVYGPLMYWQPNRPIGHEPYDFRDAPDHVWAAARALRDEVGDLLHSALRTEPKPLRVHPHQIRDLANKLTADATPLPSDRPA